MNKRKFKMKKAPVHVFLYHDYDAPFLSVMQALEKGEYPILYSLEEIATHEVKSFGKSRVNNIFLILYSDGRVVACDIDGSERVKLIQQIRYDNIAFSDPSTTTKFTTYFPINP